MFHKKKISISSCCYNEEGNLKEFYSKVIKELKNIEDKYDYEFIIIDNCSVDKSPEILKEIAAKDKRFKVILNSKNFGVFRSSFYAMQQVSGDVMIYLASDLQDPPELIPQFLEKWEEGYKIVAGIKFASKESKLMWILRQSFYKIMKFIQDDDKALIENFTGYGLYDKKIIDLIKTSEHPCPYLKSFISEVGFDVAKIGFLQTKRKAGKSKHGFRLLLDCLFIMITRHSIFPIRFMTIFGFTLSIISMIIAISYLVYKLINWNGFNMGMAPVVIGLFFFSAVQLFFIGIIGEYIGAIYTRVDKKPLIVEKERINF